MNQKLPTTESHRVVVVVRSDCPTCLDAVDHVTVGMRSFQDKKPRIINLDIEDTAGSLFETVITPAIYIDEILWAYGSVDPRILMEKLATLVDKKSSGNHRKTIITKE
ncbi:MAG TPA: hypothetical protein DHU63_08780 [Candidatus Marinimicrobia bacterium]|nr:MAG: hypothetical protein AUJ47_08940 [Candidatus Marinimicrobia bacterium CG1_02_48_14]HCW76619.1 hypothetical protein [Candidatus Neomarinimicrobiota bacterium]